MLNRGLVVHFTFSDFFFHTPPSRVSRVTMNVARLSPNRPAHDAMDTEIGMVVMSRQQEPSRPSRLDRPCSTSQTYVPAGGGERPALQTLAPGASSVGRGRSWRKFPRPSHQEQDALCQQQQSCGRRTTISGEGKRTNRDLQAFQYAIEVSPMQAQSKVIHYHQG